MTAAHVEHPSHASDPRWRTGLLLILIVAAALRAIGLENPLYIDEIVTITVAAQPLGEMGAVMRQIDASPALYPVLLHAWMLVSRSDLWVRALPAICGLLSVLMFAIVGRRAFGWRAGLAVAALAAISPPQVHYAQYVRSYSLLTLLVALHIWLLMAWMDDPRSRRLGLAGIVLVTAALLYTHYLSMLLFVAEGLYILTRWRDARSRMIAWCAAVACGGLLFLPGVPLLLHNVEHDRIRNEQRPEPPPVVRAAPDLLAELTVGQRILGFDDPRVRRATLAASLVLVPVLALTGAVREWRARRGIVLLLALVTFMPLIIYLGSGRRLVAVRFFVPFMLGYLALAGAGLAALRGWRLGAAGAAMLVLCAVPLEHYYRDFRWSYDHRTIAGAIAAQLQPGDGLVVVHPYEAFFYRWYLGDRVPITGLVFTALEDQREYVIKPPPLQFEAAVERVGRAAERHGRLWIVGGSPRSFATDPVEEARLLRWMDETLVRTGDLDALTGGDPAIRVYDVPAREGSR